MLVQYFSNVRNKTATFFTIETCKYAALFNTDIYFSALPLKHLIHKGGVALI